MDGITADGRFGHAAIFLREKKKKNSPDLDSESV
jgi:hypothetical protein